MMQEMPKFRHLVRIWTGLIRTTRAHIMPTCWSQTQRRRGNRVGISCRTMAGPQLALVPPAGLERIREICDHYGVP
jgi:hypothetical protein